MALFASALVAVALAAAAQAAIVTNGDFETGDFTGWTTFTTANGSIGPAAVVSFDTTGTGASDAAMFRVGLATPAASDVEGGGIFQSVTTPAGSFVLSANVAAYNPAVTPNQSCGLFELLVDSQVVASNDFGACDGGATVRATLTADLPNLQAGTHEIRILITRPYMSAPGNPLAYVDNVTLTQALPTTPTALSDCKQGGWRNFPGFKNQGDCVSFVATGGKNQPALG